MLLRAAGTDLASRWLCDSLSGVSHGGALLARSRSGARRRRPIAYVLTETLEVDVASLKQFKLPDVGEGLTEAEIVRWHVQPGQPVSQNQTICEIETAKALVELPSPF